MFVDLRNFLAIATCNVANNKTQASAGTFLEKAIFQLENQTNVAANYILLAYIAFNNDATSVMVKTPNLLTVMSSKLCYLYYFSTGSLSLFNTRVVIRIKYTCTT